MDANIGLVHKASPGDGHGRQGARHKSLYFLEHGKMKLFVDDYNMDKKISNSSVSNYPHYSFLSSPEPKSSSKFPDWVRGESRLGQTVGRLL